MALHRSLAAVGDGEILIEAAEVVDAHHIVQLEAVPQAGDPPLIAGFAVGFPAVERIAPELTGGRKSIRGNARHRRGDVVLVQLEQARVCPSVCRIQRHIDGDIADDPDAFAIGVGLQFAPLLIELELEIDALNDAYEETLKALFTAPDRPTAMLVSDDILAVVLEQFCGKLGLRVPKDLSIVSFNNSLFSRITSPQLTTVDVNPYQLGMEAASQTINHIENPNLLATKIIVPHKLIPRESCCPPPEV